MGFHGGGPSSKVLPALFSVKCTTVLLLSIQSPGRRPDGLVTGGREGTDDLGARTASK